MLSEWSSHLSLSLPISLSLSLCPSLSLFFSLGLIHQQYPRGLLTYLKTCLYSSIHLWIPTANLLPFLTSTYWISQYAIRDVRWSNTFHSQALQNKKKRKEKKLWPMPAIAVDCFFLFFFLSSCLICTVSFMSAEGHILHSPRHCVFVLAHVYIAVQTVAVFSQTRSAQSTNTASHPATPTPTPHSFSLSPISPWVCASLSVRHREHHALCVCVCVCVHEEERERVWVCVCVCVCTHVWLSRRDVLCLQGIFPPFQRMCERLCAWLVKWGLSLLCQLEAVRSFKYFAH